MMKRLFNIKSVKNGGALLILGILPTLAVTYNIINAIGMGVSTAIVLIAANIVISLISKSIPPKIRTATFLTIIAGLTTLVDMLLKANFPALSQNLGIFVPMIVVSCAILSRMGTYAAENNWKVTALGGITMGLGFTLVFALIGSMREILGNGTFAGAQVFGENFQPALMLSLPAGAFITLGLVLGLINACFALKTDLELY